MVEHLFGNVPSIVSGRIQGCNPEKSYSGTNRRSFVYFDSEAGGAVMMLSTFQFELDIAI